MIYKLSVHLALHLAFMEHHIALRACICMGFSDAEQCQSFSSINTCGSFLKASICPSMVDVHKYTEVPQPAVPRQARHVANAVTWREALRPE